MKLDFGATVDGYHSDMTRTFTLGGPADWQREIYDLVAAAQQAGRDACVIGAGGAEVDAASRDLIAAAGHGEHFGHGSGPRGGPGDPRRAVLGGRFRGYHGC